MTDPTAILYDAADAELFLAERPVVAGILTLTPDARAVLVRSSIDVTGSHEFLGDRAEFRIMARIRHACRTLNTALERTDDSLRLPAKEALRHDAHMLSALFLRLWFAVQGSGPWLIPNATGFDEADNPAAAHSLLLERIRRASRHHLHFLGSVAPGARFVLNSINAVAARLNGRNRVIVTHGLEYGMPHLAAHGMADPSARLVCLRGASGRSWRDVASALKSIWTGFSSSPSPLVIPARLDERGLNAAREALSSIRDPAIVRGFAVFGELVCREAVLTDSMADGMLPVLKALKPRALLAFALRWGSGAAIGEAAGRVSIPRYLVSHGSHTRLNDAIGRFVETELASGLLVSCFADRAVVQSPPAQAVLDAIAPGLPSIRCRPIMWAYRDLPPRPAKGQRTILHAGTFKPIKMPRPWVYETPDEYLEGIAALIRAIEPLRNTELVIRLRPLPECSVATMETLLPRAANCRFQTGGSFLDDLSRADLLVSYSSTTIEEALHSRRPVLLWGGAKRYRHLPARGTIPTMQDRAAVYGTEEPAALSELIAGILDAHHARPLTDEEIAPYVWPAGTGGGGELVELMVRPPGSVAQPLATPQGMNCLQAP